MRFLEAALERALGRARVAATGDEASPSHHYQPRAPAAAASGTIPA